MRTETLEDHQDEDKRRWVKFAKKLKDQHEVEKSNSQCRTQVCMSFFPIHFHMLKFYIHVKLLLIISISTKVITEIWFEIHLSFS